MSFIQSTSELLLEPVLKYFVFSRWGQVIIHFTGGAVLTDSSRM